MDATNIWSVRVNSGGTVLDEPRHWTSGTEVEQYPDAVVTAKGLTRAVYAALTISSSIWRIPLSAAGQGSGDPELLTAMYRAGSPSLSRDGGMMAFSTRQPLGETIQLAELGSGWPVASSTVHLGSNTRPVLSGDGRTVAWVNNLTGYIMGVKGDAPQAICPRCGQPTHLNFDGTKAIFESSSSALKTEELQLAVRDTKGNIWSRGTMR
jgi:hypothetical protein